MVRNTRLNIAFLGCGRVADHYLNLIVTEALDGINLIACCDLDSDKTVKFVDQTGAHAYGSYEEMLTNEDIDLIAILTESGNHFRHAKQALIAGKHVLVEKPVCMIPEQANELQSIADDSSLMCAAVFQNRFNPAILHLKEAIDGGRFGKIITASIRLRWCRYQEYYEDGWHGTWAMDGGVSNQQAIHHIDALNWLNGPVEKLTAFSTRRMNDLEAEDTLVASLAFNNGSLGTIELTTAARPEDFEASLSIVGEGGMATIGGVALNELQQWEFIDKDPDDDLAMVGFSQTVPNGYGLGHIPLLNEIAKSLKSNSIVPPLTALEGAKAVELVHALYASIELNKTVELNENIRSSKLGK